MKNKAKYIYRIEWFCITVIVTVLLMVALPSLELPFFVSKACARSPVKSPPTKTVIGQIAKGQQVYYWEHGHFATSMQQLERELGGLLPSTYLGIVENNWEISIQIKDDIAFAYAVAKYANPRFYSYVAATTAYGKTNNGQWIICRTLEPSTVQPAAPILQESQQFIFWRHDAKLVCSSGTENC